MTKLTYFICALLLFSTLSAQYTTDSIKLNEGYLYYYTKGQGKPIVLLQGGPGFSSYYMRGIADSLIGYKCILIDYEGTGKSQSRKPDTSWVSVDKVIKDVELVRKQLNITSWDIIGHSYGTHFGLNYAITFPTRVNKIILVSSIGTNNAFQKYANDNAMVRLTNDDLSQLDRIEKDTTLNAVEKEFQIERIILKSYFFDHKKIDPFLKWVPKEEKSSYFSNDFFAAYFDNANFWKWDIAKQTYQLAKPIRIIQGRQDFLNDGQQALMNERSKNSKILYIERAGHFPWVEQPAKFFPVLRKQLETN